MKRRWEEFVSVVINDDGDPELMVDPADNCRICKKIIDFSVFDQPEVILSLILNEIEDLFPNRDQSISDILHFVESHSNLIVPTLKPSHQPHFETQKSRIDFINQTLRRKSICLEK